MNTKDKVALLAQRSLSETSDNLYRTKRKFEGMNSEELKTLYGQSGKTCQEILDYCINANADAQLQLDWVLSRRE